MRRILIGHRGVGKSLLLQRLAGYQSMVGTSVPFFDLDREIEKINGASIGKIFSSMGEKSFREMEKRTLDLLMTTNKDFVIALGAGFPLDDWKLDNWKKEKQPAEDLEIIWIRRPSDCLGRIFNSDRPRLNPRVPPLEEFRERYDKRNEVYFNHATWVYDLPEGKIFPSLDEEKIFKGQIKSLTGGLTLSPFHLRNFESFKHRELTWGFDYFELRDDLLSDEEINKANNLLEKNQILISFRRKELASDSMKVRKVLKMGVRTDWALELGTEMPPGVQIISVHERAVGESVSQVIHRLEKSSCSCEKPSLKLAIEIYDFEELREGLQWQSLEPTRRSFLPRSWSGRWSWVRQWLKDRQLLNFVRLGIVSMKQKNSDQPTLMEWMATPNKTKSFAAILGSPVSYSYSPSEHREYFGAKGIPFFPIEIYEEEWDKAMELLTQMGLCAAAVTSPLKKRAFQFCQAPSSLGSQLGVLNTLWREPETASWRGENTDLEGFESLLKTLEFSNEWNFKKIIVWGGGGILPVIHKLLPQAIDYSMRSGLPRLGSHDPNPSEGPEIIIWAGPPTGSPPQNENWRPKIVIDLNYREDSLAKEYGERHKAQYVSGWLMFKAQAEAQQKLWRNITGLSLPNLNKT